MDRLRLVALALIGLVLPLAGCIGGKEPVDAARARPDAEPAPSSPVPDAPSEGVEAPVWSVGDAWAIVPLSGEGNASTLVVTSADGASYFVSTTDQESAAYDALHDASYLGRIRRADLAGEQDGQPVQYFSFPLTDGKTWETTWDGHAVRLKATWSPAMRTSVGIQGGFVIEGRVGEELYVAYDYVPALRWWSHLEFAGGWGFQVQRAYDNWAGGIVVAEARTLLESAEGLPNLGTFTVDEGQAFVSVRVSGNPDAFVRGLLLVDPAGAPYPTSAPVVEADLDGFSWEDRIPPTPGAWRIASPVLHAGGSVDLSVRQVELTLVAFG